MDSNVDLQPEVVEDVTQAIALVEGAAVDGKAQRAEEIFEGLVAQEVAALTSVGRGLPREEIEADVRAELQRQVRNYRDSMH